LECLIVQKRATSKVMYFKQVHLGECDLFRLENFELEFSCKNMIKP